MGNKCEKHFCNKETPSIYFNHWMQSLNNTSRLSSLTIPGTHNSCSFFGTAIAITQSWSIPLQLKAGIRYFDIRLRRYDNTLRLQHGIMDQKCTFDVILAHFKEFLKEQPSECIIMAVQHEYKEKNSTKTMEELFEEYTKDYKDIITTYQGKDVTIGEVRGRILFINVFHGKIHMTPGFKIQNEWVVNFPANIKDKKHKVKRLFNRAVKLVNDGNIYMNYLSGVSDYGIVTPARCAEDINKEVFKFTGRLGIVLLDFPGEELIEYLIDQNFLSMTLIPIYNPLTYYSPGNDDIDISNQGRICLINLDTKKSLALNEKYEFICQKEKCYFNISARKSGSSLICNGDVINLIYKGHLFGLEIVISKRIVKLMTGENVSDKNKPIEVLTNGDVVRLAKNNYMNIQEKDEGNNVKNMYLHSGYTMKNEEFQLVDFIDNKEDTGCDWVIEVIKNQGIIN